MEEYVLRTYGLTKKYGNKIVLNNVNLGIKKGDIYGFIGPNGAGKTTAMKAILDLVTPSEGAIELFGMPRTSGSLNRVGSLIEAPGLYTAYKGYENMKRFSIICGGTDEDIRFYLRMVGLEGVGNKKVGAFSLGMKQRLGIAIALLGNPELLILDEPVNGLDPMGMRDVRDIIQFINKERGVTFFISSHLLGELEKIANVYGIINCGMLLEEITAEELETRCGFNVVVKCSEPEKALSVLKEKFSIENITVDNNTLTIPADPALSAKINTELVTSGVMVSELGINRISYEEYLLNRMGMLNVGSGVGQYA